MSCAEQRGFDHAVGDEVDSGRQVDSARPASAARTRGRSRVCESIRAGSWSSPGWGASARGSSSLRSMPSRRRRSASASRPVCSTLRIDSRARSGSLREQPPRAAGLDHHRAHAVGDDVLQLAADPRAFLGDRGRLALGLLGGGLRRELAKCCGAAAAFADQSPGEPRREEQHARVEENVGGVAQPAWRRRHRTAGMRCDQ